MHRPLLAYWHFVRLYSNNQPRQLKQTAPSSLPPSLVTVGCSQVLKANFFFCTRGQQQRHSHLGNNHHPLFAEQTMVPFQPAWGRQGKGQPSNSGTYRSVNILHSFSASKNSSAREARRSQSESLWLETTDKCTGLRRSNKSPKSAVRSFPLIFLLALLFPSLIHTEGRKTHLFKLILSIKSQVFSFQVALTEVFSVCQNILKNCLPALVVLCTQWIKSRFQKRSLWS